MEALKPFVYSLGSCNFNYLIILAHYQHNFGPVLRIRIRTFWLDPDPLPDPTLKSH